jgi:hypothetical protein
MLANVSSSESSIICGLFGFSSLPFSDIFAQKGLRILLGALIALASSFLLIMDDTEKTQIEVSERRARALRVIMPGL